MPITLPIMRNITRTFTGGATNPPGVGGGLGLLFSALLQNSLIPTKATGSAVPTYTRASDGTFYDFEGVVRTALSGEARFKGARRVEQLLSGNTDTTLAASTTVIVGHDYLMHFAGTGTIGLTGAATDSLAGTSGSRSVFDQFTASTTTLTHSVSSGTCSDFMLEDVTGQANQNPSSYISNGVLSAPWHGAGVDGVKYFSYANGNTVSGNVVTEAQGAAFDATDSYCDADGPFGYVSESAATNLALHNRDFTDAVWTATNVTTAKDATGADGVLNAASTLTASAGNGTVLQTVTSASADRVVSCLVKRKTGTGTIEITADGGTTWADITTEVDAAGYTLAEATKAAVTNPQIGFRIVTSADAIEVDYFGLEDSSFASSPIETAGSSVTRAADVLTYDDTDNIQDAAGCAYCEASTLWGLALNASAIGRAQKTLFRNGSSDRVSASDGTNVSTTNIYGSMEGVVQSLAATWGDTLLAYYTGHSDTSPAAYDGTIGTGDIGIGCYAAGTNQWNGTIRSVSVYSEELTAAQVADL